VWLVPLVPVLVALSYIDWHTRLLPRLVVLPATLLAAVAVVAVGLATDERDALVRALVALVAVRSFFWLLWFVRSAGMGFGDVRLAALVGLVLGWVGWGTVAIGVWVGFVAFAVPGLLLAVVRRDRSLLKQAFPFGPFMALGALVGLVWGPALSRALWG
jgi:leader peptidase (prepilin peptidase)/N-methyltransferase